MSKIKHAGKTEFLPPHKHVFLLSCMDSRLLDDTVKFMNTLNLENRYDQVVFAGAALGVMGLKSPTLTGGGASVWKDVFFHHLQVAIDVLERKIKNVYVLEHRDCGAYEHFHPDWQGEYGDDEGRELEEKHHREQAFALADEIRGFCAAQRAVAMTAERAAREAGDEKGAYLAGKRRDAWRGIRVDCFLMDLKGDVEHLGSFPCDADEAAKPAKRSKKKDH